MRLFLLSFRNEIYRSNVIFSILFLSCLSNEKANSEKEEKPISRILNQELMEILPELINIQNKTFDDEITNRNYDNKHLFARFLTTENYVYLNLTFIDCGFTGFYPFQEKLGKHTLDVLIDSKGYKPERYFDLENLNKIPDPGPQICDDWYFVKAKFELIEDKLTLIKISTFFDNDYSDDFYEKSDSAYLHKIEVLMVEPEPTTE